MPIRIRDFFDFLFNDGKGIRANQVQVQAPNPPASGDTVEDWIAELHGAGATVDDNSLLDVAQVPRTASDRGKRLAVSGTDENDLVLVDPPDPDLAILDLFLWARDTRSDISLGSGQWFAVTTTGKEVYVLNNDNHRAEAWDADGTRLSPLDISLTAGHTYPGMGDNNEGLRVVRTGTSPRIELYRFDTRGLDINRNITISGFTGVSWEGLAVLRGKIYVLAVLGLGAHLRVWDDEDGSRLSSDDINLGVGDWSGVAADERYLYVFNNTDNIVYVFDENGIARDTRNFPAATGLAGLGIDNLRMYGVSNSRNMLEVWSKTLPIDQGSIINAVPGTPSNGEVIKYSSSQGGTLEWSPDEQGSGGGGGLSAVESDSTLAGDGTTTSRLRVTNPFTDADEAKLDGIQASAEVNVQSDWNQTNTSSDSFIRNKPTSLGGLDRVSSDTTLFGDGTASNPLGVELPFSAAEEAKLAGIQAGAQVNRTTEQVQDLVGAMAGTGLSYDDSRGMINAQAGGLTLGSTITITGEGELDGEAVRVGTANQFGVNQSGPTGLASHNGTLYMVGTSPDALYSVNTTTGVASRRGSADRFGLSTIGRGLGGGLASHNGTLYLLGSNINVDALYTISTTTGRATRVGSVNAFGVNEFSPGGITSHNGLLYIVGTSNDALFTVNTTTGRATRVGSANQFGVGEGTPRGLTSHNGILYMVGSGNRILYSLDAITGMATRIGSSTEFGIAERSPSGLASHNGTLYMVGQTTGALFSFPEAPPSFTGTLQQALIQCGLFA